MRYRIAMTLLEEKMKFGAKSFLRNITLNSFAQSFFIFFILLTLPIPGFSNGLFMFPEGQNIFFNNNNLTVKNFWSTYTSESAEVRRYAEMYMLGVVDAAEGKSWCSYRNFKTITISEAILSGLEPLVEVKKNERAAYVITDILSKKFPCKKE
jgi:hypothetical protein